MSVQVFSLGVSAFADGLWVRPRSSDEGSETVGLLVGSIHLIQKLSRAGLIQGDPSLTVFFLLFLCVLWLGLSHSVHWNF